MPCVERIARERSMLYDVTLHADGHMQSLAGFSESFPGTMNYEALANENSSYKHKNDARANFPLLENGTINYTIRVTRGAVWY